MRRTLADDIGAGAIVVGIDASDEDRAILQYALRSSAARSVPETVSLH
jgi:hypothetical protein